MSSTIQPGIVSLLGGANKSDRGIKFTLDGDLSQMAAQKTFLENRGITVGQTDVYPGFTTEEAYKAALKLVWENRVPGWWHYENAYIKYDICTADAFSTALGRPVDKK